MARAVRRLSARTVATVSKPGRHADGDGLYLVVDSSGARRWLFMFRWAGKLKEMGLGGIASVSLADARSKAEEARKLVAGGINPIEARKEAEATRNAAQTFGEFADDMLLAILPGFKNPRHKAQWTRALKHYAAPIRNKLPGDVTTEDVLRIIQPLWHTKQETASRVRGRIERVLAAAKAKRLIPSPWENPARWRGHLQELLSKRQKLSRGHHAAMPYPDVPAFYADLRSRDAIAARALEFTLLTAGRSNEVLGALWSEFDMERAIWTVPIARMKTNEVHRVPLSSRAMHLLSEMEKLKVSDFVFPGRKPKRPLSGMAMEMLMRRMKADELDRKSVV